MVKNEPDSRKIKTKAKCHSEKWRRTLLEEESSIHIKKINGFGSGIFKNLAAFDCHFDF